MDPSILGHGYMNPLRTDCVFLGHLLHPGPHGSGLLGFGGFEKRCPCRYSYGFSSTIRILGRLRLHPKPLFLPLVRSGLRGFPRFCDLAEVEKNKDDLFSGWVESPWTLLS